MSQIPPTRDSRSADESLPPVEPPSAGFILQLFVVPAVMVLIIVAVWLMFNWLAHMGDDPQNYVDALRRGNVARWQAAVNLANALHRPNSPLTKDVALADELSKLLDTELQTPGEPEDEDIQLRAYLCKALGEFEIPVGLSALLRAADAQTNIQVRRAALESIALLASNAGQKDPLHDPRLYPVLIAASADEESGIREAAAFTLGVLGGPESVVRLQALLKDSSANVRFNAATGLARWGDREAVPVLVEMLEPANTGGSLAALDEAVKSGKMTADEKGLVIYKQQLILVNALAATLQLAEHNPTADLQPLVDAIAKLADSDVNEKIRVRARDEVLEKLRARAP